MDGTIILEIKSFMEEMVGIVIKYSATIPATILCDKIQNINNELMKQAEIQYQQAMKIKESEVSADGEKDN